MKSGFAAGRSARPKKEKKVAYAPNWIPSLFALEPPEPEVIVLFRYWRISPASCIPAAARMLSDALYARPHSWTSARVRVWKRVELVRMLEDGMLELWISATLIRSYTVRD